MNALSGANVLVTGGLGFIGSNLAARLLAGGATVTLCDAMIEGYGGNPANIAEIRGRVEVDTSDVRDAAAMERLVDGRDIVFHLAAQVSHVMSLSNPYPDIDINIKGTAVVLEACRKKNPRAVDRPLGHARPVRPRGEAAGLRGDAFGSARHLRDLPALLGDDLPDLHPHPRHPHRAPAADQRLRPPRPDAPLAVRRRELVRAPRARGAAHPDLRDGEDPARLSLRRRLRRGPRRRRRPPPPPSERSSTSDTTVPPPFSRSRSCSGRSCPARGSSSPSSRPSARRRSPATSFPTSRRSGGSSAGSRRPDCARALRAPSTSIATRRAEYF